MRPTLFGFSIFALSLSACGSQDIEPEAPDPASIGGADIIAADGKQIGSAALTLVDDELSLVVTMEGLEPGQHGFHLHAVGACEGPDFTSAGGHLNPFDRAHGSLNPDGQHLGDLPNITVDDDGSASLSFTFSDPPNQLIDQIFDSDGTSVMLHAGPDDYLSDPAGAAGPRIACGIIEPTS